MNLYESNETLFNNNGLEILDDIIINAEVERTLNGSFFANVIILKDKLGKYKKIRNERIITLYTPSGVQPFRIVDVNPVNGAYLNLVVKQVVHDINKRVVKRCKVDNGNGAFTLNKFKSSLDKPIPHNFTSDITINSSFDWVRKKALNILIGDDDNSFLNKYGGELDVNGFNVSINKRIGTDRGFIAKYRKNIKAFNALYTTDPLITRIIPVGFDGITLTDNDHVDSPNINNYYDVYCDVIEFKDIKYKDSPNNSEGEGYETLEEAQEALKAAALEYFKTTKCDEIPFTSTIDVAMLKDTVEYKDTALFEEIQLGDDVLVDIEEDNIKTKQRMTYYKYNSLSRKYITVTLGLTIDDYFKEINDSLKDTVTKEELDNELGAIIDKAFQEVNDKIQNGGKLSYIKFLPSLINPSEIIACDNEDLNKAVYVVRINKAGLGVSTTGYNGTYQGLITEGKLALNEMTCRQFTAALIRTGMLSDVTGKTWINMDNGNFNFADKIKFDGNNFTINLNSGKTIEDEIKTVVDISKDGIIAQVGNEYAKKTELSLIGDTLTAKLISNGGNNLLRNGGFENGLKYWYRNGNCDYKLTGGTPGFESYSASSLLVYGKGANAGYFQSFSCIPGKKYYCTFMALRDGVNPTDTVIGIEGLAGVNLDSYQWKQYVFQFTATQTRHTFIAYAKGTGNFYIDNVMVAVGEIPTGYVDYSGELYSGIVKIDADGQRIDFEDGTYVMIGRDGFKYYIGGSGHTYCSLIYTGSFSVSSAFYGSTMGINLPEEFRGKDVKVLVFPVEYQCEEPFAIQKILCQVQGQVNPINGHFTIRYGCHVLNVTNGWDNKDIGMTVGYIALA